MRVCKTAEKCIFSGFTTSWSQRRHLVYVYDDTKLNPPINQIPVSFSKSGQGWYSSYQPSTYQGFLLCNMKPYSQKLQYKSNHYTFLLLFSFALFSNKAKIWPAWFGHWNTRLHLFSSWLSRSSFPLNRLQIVQNSAARLLARRGIILHPFQLLYTGCLFVSERILRFDG